MAEPQQQRAPAEPAGRSPGWSLHVATVMGIPIRIHFSFLILLAWFALVSSGQGAGVVGGLLALVLLFSLVLLHELGHAAMARVFGVKTRDIVLYPIGGVARMEDMPEGKAELLIALALQNESIDAAGEEP